MIVGLDTSVVLRLLVGEPHDLALVAVREFQERSAAGDRILVADWVVAEAYHALQHHYGVTKADALTALRAFLASPEVENPGNSTTILATPRLETAKPGFVDRVLHAEYQHHQAAEMLTFEKAAARLEGVRVLTAA